MNLWTIGCTDPRLTAQARSPMDKPGKTQCVSPTLPTGRRLPTSFTAPRNKKRSIRFRGNGETISRLPAFSLCLPGSCPNNRDRRSRARITNRAHLDGDGPVAKGAARDQVCGSTSSAPLAGVAELVDATASKAVLHKEV